MPNQAPSPLGPGGSKGAVRGDWLQGMSIEGLQRQGQVSVPSTQKVVCGCERGNSVVCFCFLRCCVTGVTVKVVAAKPRGR